MQLEECPLCGKADAESFLTRSSVPVHQHTLFLTKSSARSMKRGDLEMRLCRNCGFAFNAAFDPALVEYDQTYENSQDCSPTFEKHLDDLIDHLVSNRGVQNGVVVEVGCGKGKFLSKLIAHPDNHSEAVGFDPSYLGPEQVGPRVRIVKEFYTPETALPADTVICRHVIEHIPRPIELLNIVRAAVGDSGRTQVFFETPAVEWILENRVPWDFFYEHCSLFSADSLRFALEQAGFSVLGVRHIFGDQYLWAEGSVGIDLDGSSAKSASPRTHRANTLAILQLAKAFAKDEQGRLSRWHELVRSLSREGPVFAWGAGAKGVTFCNLVDPDGSRLSGVVDVNPAKQGKFLPGSGHPILSPVNAVNQGVASVLIFNPNYTVEVQANLKLLGSQAKVVDLMQTSELLFTD